MRWRFGVALVAWVAVVAAWAATPAHAVPRAAITGGPPAETDSTSAEFTFEAGETALLARFECRLDGGPWQACSSPRRYDGLTGGPHSLAVRLSGALVDSTPDRRD